MKRCAGPYAQGAELWLAAGWSPLPIPYPLKSPPPEGYTGNGGKYATADEVHRWIDTRGADQVCVRLPKVVIGVDLDLYKDGARDRYRQLVKKLGPLPNTWYTSACSRLVRYPAVPASRRR